MAIDPNTQRPRPPKLSDFAPPQLQGTLAPPLPNSRTAGEKVSDSLRGIAQGGQGIASAFAQVPNLLTGGAVDDYVVRPAQRALDRALGGVGQDYGLAGASGRMTEGLSSGLSPVLKAEQQKLQDADGWWEKAKTVATNPTLLGQFTAEQVPMLATLGVGAAGSATAKGAQVLARGGTQAAAQQAGKKAAERALIGANTAMGGGFAGNAAMQDALSQPQEVWDANPDYQTLVRGGVTPDDAKQQLALKAGQIAGAIAAPISGAAGAITAPLEASIFTRTLGGGVPALFSREGAGIVGRGIAKEAAEEAIQEGGEQFGQNVGIQQAVDPTRALSQDVADNAAIGGVLGGVLGGGLTAGGLALSRPPLQDAPPAARGQPAQQPQPAAPRPPSPAEQEQQLRQAVAMAQTPEEAAAASQALAGFLEQQGRLLEPPQTIVGDSQGNLQTNAPTPPQLFDAPRIRLGSVPGGVGSVQQAPRAAPRVPFPDAPPGTLQDAVNAVAEAQPKAAPAAPIQPPALRPGETLDPTTGEVRQREVSAAEQQQLDLQAALAASPTPDLITPAGKRGKERRRDAKQQAESDFRAQPSGQLEQPVAAGEGFAEATQQAAASDAGATAQGVSGEADRLDGRAEVRSSVGDSPDAAPVSGSDDRGRDGDAARAVRDAGPIDGSVVAEAIQAPRSADKRMEGGVDSPAAVDQAPIETPAPATQEADADGRGRAAEPVAQGGADGVAAVGPVGSGAPAARDADGEPAVEAPAGATAAAAAAPGATEVDAAAAGFAANTTEGDTDVRTNSEQGPGPEQVERTAEAVEGAAQEEGEVGQPQQLSGEALTAERKRLGLPRVIRKADAVAALRRAGMKKTEAEAAFNTLERKGLKEGTRMGDDVAALIAARTQPAASAPATGEVVDSDSRREPAGSAAAVEPPAAAPEAAAGAQQDSPAKAKALRRIEKGTAFFATRARADEFIAAAGLGDTHEAVQAKPTRFDVRPKQAAADPSAEQPAAEALPKRGEEDRKAMTERGIKPGMRVAYQGKDGRVEGVVRAVGRNQVEADVDGVWVRGLKLEPVARARGAGMKRGVSNAVGAPLLPRLERAVGTSSDADVIAALEQMLESDGMAVDALPVLQILKKAAQGLTESSRKEFNAAVRKFASTDSDGNVSISDLRGLAAPFSRVEHLIENALAAALKRERARARQEQPQDAASARVEAAASEAATSPTNGLPEPTDAQKDAGIVIRSGKGRISDQFLADVDGESVPGGPWASEAVAREAAEAWKKSSAERAASDANERGRRERIAQKFRVGEPVSDSEIESLGLRLGTSDMRWFMPTAAQLFGLTSRDIRPIVKDLIRTGFTDMGAKREFVPTRRALEAVAKHENSDQQSQSAVEAVAAEAATSPANNRPEPTDAQKDAGNYKKGALSLHGLRISIENPAGTRRRPEWPPLAHHYGYIRGTEGKDGEQVDVFLGPGAENAELPVFVVDQVTQAGRFDEHKVMLGFADEAAARAGYLANYSEGWQGLGDITPMALADFKAWVMDPARTSKRASADAQLQEAEAATVAEAPAPAPTAEDTATAPIRDFGEKIGGARKDTAVPTGARGKTAREAEDDRPTWAKRYEVSQVAASTLDPEETGRWMIRDKRTKDRMGQQKQVGERAGYATREEAKAALPLIELARNHRITMSSRADGEREFLIVRSVTDRKYVVLKNGFASREEAMRYMVENAVELIETRTSFGEIDLPLPPSRQRQGAARRDRDVRDSDFSEVFGFRGVEFGNWNNQTERQELLNDAYDGLIDLSDVLGIPPRAISLGGELALAFGARGHGLSGARAHYEPTRPVINLTKENGAGSLAHEWMHALDHYLWRRGNPRVKWKTNDDGTRSLDLIGNDFDLNSMSGGTARDNVRPEVRELFQKLNATMGRKAVEYVNDTAKVEAWVAKARDQVKSELDTLRGYLARPIDYAKRNNKPASADQLAAFDTLAEQILTGRDVTLRAESPPKARKGSYSTRWTNDALNGISAILKSVRGTEGFASDGKGSMNRIANFVRYYAQRLDEMAKANEGETEVKAVPTDFKRAAKELDQGRTGDYWSLPSEMLARAFQGYVEDKIAERGGFSPFLNFGPEQAVIVSPWGFVAPFPRGAERKAINGVFDELFQTLQVSDEGDGRVGLFSLPEPEPQPLFSDIAGRPTRAPGLAPSQLQAAIAGVIQGWNADTAPRVRVLADPEGLPARAKRDPRYRRAEGFFDQSNRTIYLVASNLPTERRALQVLAHEAVGHYGMEAITGPELWAELEAAIARLEQTASGRVGEALASARRRYAGADRATFTKEAIAVMAEQGAQNSIVARVVAAVRRFLRSLGFDLRLSESDVLAMIRDSARYLQRGQQPTAEQAVTGAAFARPDLDPKQRVPAVEATANRFGPTGTEEERHAAREAASEYLRQAREAGPYTNADSGLRIGLSVAGNRELMAWTADPSKLDLLGVLPQIAEQSVLAKVEAGRGNLRVRFATFYVPVQVGQKLRIARMVAREAGNGVYVYDLQQSALLDARSPEGSTGDVPAAKAGASGERSGPRAMTVAELRAAVNADPREAWNWSMPADRLPGLTVPERTTAAGVLRTMAEQGGLFRYPPSNATDLAKVFDEVTEGTVSATFKGETLANFTEDLEDMAEVQKWELRTKDGRPMFVYVEIGGENRMYVDASPGRSGASMGSAVYAALFQYALNDGKVMIGDPNGLSPEALLRRTEHMLSAALKHGTTRMMAPHPRQVDPSQPQWDSGPQAWAHPLRWQSGNDEANLRALIETTYHNAAAFLRGTDGEGAVYSFPAKKFLTRDGRELTPADLARISKQAGKSWPAGLAEPLDNQNVSLIGPTTVARSILAGTLLRAEDSQLAKPLLSDMNRRVQAGATEPAQGLFYSLREPEAMGAAADPRGFLDRLSGLVKPDNVSLREAIGAKLQDIQPAALGALTLRHIAELGKKYLPQLPSYIDNLNRMQTDRNVLQEEGNELAEKWRGMQAKDRNSARDMADLMHDATIEGVDPAEEYQPLTFVNLSRETVPITDAALKDHIKRVRAQFRSRPGDSKVEALAGIKELRQKLAAEKRRRRSYPELVARWNRLPADWQALYREARDMYAKRSDQTLQALMDRIGELDMPDDQKRKTGSEIRLMFEAARVAGPYFPLQRFGNYWLAAKNPDTGKRDFFMFESAADQLAAKRDLEVQGYTDIGSGKKLEQARDAFGAGEGFITEVQRKLQKSGAPSDLQDEIWQLYLRTLPDLSQRKHMIHRKKVAGYNPDALRAFAANANHGAYQIARLRYGHKMQRLMMQAKQWADSSAKTDQGNQASIYYNEMVKRHEWVMNPSDSALVNKISGLGFFWYLGVTPGAALVNLTQTAIVAGPVLASRFGAAKTMNALSKGMRDSIRTGGNIERTLRDEELRAYQAMRASGAIDKTQAHNLAGIAEVDSAQYSDSWHRVMKGISFLFHKAEVVNREATGIAAFRLGREQGMSFDAAVQYAENVIWESHFDYCVDTDTEALTLEGWKRYDQIRPGERVLGVDQEGRAVETNVEQVNVFPGAKHVLRFESSRRFSMVLTPAHDALVQRYDSKPKRWTPIAKVPADQLKGHHQILRAPLAPIEGREKHHVDDFAALLGWIAAEGQFAKFRGCDHRSDVRLAQSTHHNPAYVDEIRGILERLGGEFSEYSTRKGEIIVWTLKGELRRRVVEAMPEKLLHFGMLQRMTADQMVRVIDAFAKGDGHRRPGGGWTIVQKAGENAQNLEVLQAMATACGITATVSHKGPFRNLILCTGERKNTQRTIVKSLKVSPATVDTVWCPATGTGNWIARRNGAVFVTGNSNANRARFMQSGAAKVLLMFRQYSLSMSYFLWRNFYQTFKGESPKIKAEARRKLLGVLGMTSVFSGALGLPLTSMVFGVANAMASAFGDDDEPPFDAEAEFRNFLTDFMGADVARLIARGPVNFVTGADIASRVTLDGLWLREPERELEGKALANYWLQQAAGPIGGIFVGAMQSLSLMHQGEAWRAVEAGTPKFVRDALRSIRYSTEGVNTLRGDALIPDLSPAETVLQLAGLAPAQVNERYDANNAIKRYEEAILRNRQRLLDGFALAVRLEDDGMRDSTLQRIRAFNQANPEIPIDAGTIRASLQSRQRYTERSLGGIAVNAKIEARAREQGRFAEDQP